MSTILVNDCGCWIKIFNRFDKNLNFRSLNISAIQQKTRGVDCFFQIISVCNGFWISLSLFVWGSWIRLAWLWSLEKAMRSPCTAGNSQMWPFSTYHKKIFAPSRFIPTSFEILPWFLALLESHIFSQTNLEPFYNRTIIDFNLSKNFELFLHDPNNWRKWSPEKIQIFDSIKPYWSPLILTGLAS